MNTIRVVEDRMYFYAQPVPIPKGQVGFSKLRFLFSEDWYGKNKIAQFEQGDHLFNQSIAEGECDIPVELEVGSCVLYVKGYNLDGSPQIATANGIILNLVQGAREGGTPAVPPPPDLYSQLLERIKEAATGALDPTVVAKAVEDYLRENPPSGGVQFETDTSLSLKEGILSVNTTDLMEQNNTLPITSAGVYATVGNIEALLKTI